MKKIFTLLTLALCLASCGVDTKKTEKTMVKYNFETVDGIKIFYRETTPTESTTANSL